MPYRSLLLMLLLCSLVLQAESCWHPGPRGLLNGDDDGNIIDDPEGRCTELPGSSLRGLDFIPRHDGLFIDGPLWVVNQSAASQGLLAFDADTLPPASYVPSRDVTIPADSDGDGEADAAILGGLRIMSLSLGLITARGYDEVLFFNPSNIDTDVDGGLARYAVSVPGSFADNDYPNLPDPGDTAESRTAVSTKACIRVDTDANNSDGTLVNVAELQRCDGEGSNTYYSSFTTGATVVNDRLFVSLINPEDTTNQEAPIFRPGTVLAFDFTGLTVEPETQPTAHPSVIITEGYNPSDVISYTTPGDDPYVLVVVGGPIGIRDERFVEVTYPSPDVDVESFIEVIDAEDLGLVKSLSLGDAALSGVSALDPAKRVLVVGSAVDRTLYSIDLDQLSDLNATWAFTAYPVPLPAGETAPADCPGSISGMAISDDLAEIYAVDYCMGTLIVVETDEFGALTKIDEFPLTERIDEPDPAPGDETVALKDPRLIAVRPGTPGTSYEGSDLFVQVNQPVRQVCAQSVQGN